MKKFFTSESVTSGHPDKICDAISDAILDEALRQDPASKMAVETTIKDNLIFIYGEANTSADLPFEKIAKDKIREIGYTEEFEVLTKVSKQSAEIYEADPCMMKLIWARAIRELCSVTPATKQKTICRCRLRWLTGWRNGWNKSANRKLTPS